MTRLRYELDETIGLPRLRTPAGVLSQGDHTALERLLQKHYRRLVEDGRRKRVVRVRLASGPASFRVTVRPGASRRSPALVLERLPESDKSEGCRCQSEWVSALAAEWEELMHARLLLGVSEDEQAVVESAVAVLLRRGGERPDAFARLLLAGCLERAGRLALRSDPKKARRYALAARSLTHGVPSEERGSETAPFITRG